MTRHDDRVYLTHIISHARKAIDLLGTLSAEDSPPLIAELDRYLAS